MRSRAAPRPPITQMPVSAKNAAAQSAAGAARTEVERLVVRAPIAGEILAVNIRPGEFVATQGGGNAQVVIVAQKDGLFQPCESDGGFS